MPAARCSPWQAEKGTTHRTDGAITITIGNATASTAKPRFGEQGGIDLGATNGYYITMMATLNAAQT